MNQILSKHRDGQQVELVNKSFFGEDDDYKTIIYHYDVYEYTIEYDNAEELALDLTEFYKLNKYVLFKTDSTEMDKWATIEEIIVVHDYQLLNYIEDEYYSAYLIWGNKGEFKTVEQYKKECYLIDAMPVRMTNREGGDYELGNESADCYYVDVNEEYILGHDGERLYEVEDVADYGNDEEPLYKIVGAC